MPAEKKSDAQYDALIGTCIRIAGSVTAGVLLFRINGWSRGGKGGFKRDGQLWVTRSNPQWCHETGLTPKQLRTAFEQLVDKGIITRKHYPLEHRSFIRINFPDEMPVEPEETALVEQHTAPAGFVAESLHPDMPSGALQ